MPQIELSDGKEPILLRDYEFGWEICWQRNRYPDPTDKTIVEKYWAAAKWYPTLDTAIKSISEFKLRNSDATTLKELLDVVKSTREELTGVYNANHM